MLNLDFNSKGKIHFTGIGGISMSGLAEIMLEKGFTVTGSDSTKSDITNHLEELGARVNIGQRSENVDDDVDILVYTAAVKSDNPELVAAREKGIPLATRSQFLGEIMKRFDVAIGVAGTHGKTTTTSMLSQIMLTAETDPTILVGGIMPAIKGNTRIGHSDIMITEACEYTNSFLDFSPSIGIILNIAEDHLDFFKDINDIRNSFRKYAELIPAHGALVINSEIDNLHEITDGLKCKVITFGLDPEKSYYSAANIEYHNDVTLGYDLIVAGENKGRIDLNGSGRHNVLNSLAAIAAANFMRIHKGYILEGLKNYCGTERRFQYKGMIGEARVIDDYAHHPDEINATISTIRNFDFNKMWVVFQPHTYTRTAALLEEFADSLSKADAVVLAEIYAAREKNTLGISSKDLMEELKKRGTEVYYFPTFDEIEKFLLEKLQPQDLLITMGAGDVVNIGNHLLGK